MPEHKRQTEAPLVQPSIEDKVENQRRGTANLLNNSQNLAESPELPRGAIVIRFRAGRENDYIGEVLHDPHGLTRGSQKIVLISRDYQGPIHEDGTLVCQFIRDTKPGDRKGAFIVKPLRELRWMLKPSATQVANGIAKMEPYCPDWPEASRHERNIPETIIAAATEANQDYDRAAEQDHIFRTLSLGPEFIENFGMPTQVTFGPNNNVELHYPNRTKTVWHLHELISVWPYKFTGGVRKKNEGSWTDQDAEVEIQFDETSPPGLAGKTLWVLAPEEVNYPEATRDQVDAYRAEGKALKEAFKVMAELENRWPHFLKRINEAQDEINVLVDIAGKTPGDQGFTVDLPNVRLVKEKDTPYLSRDGWGMRGSDPSYDLVITDSQNQVTKVNVSHVYAATKAGISSFARVMAALEHCQNDLQQKMEEFAAKLKRAEELFRTHPSIQGILGIHHDDFLRYFPELPAAQNQVNDFTSVAQNFLEKNNPEKLMENMKAGVARLMIQFIRTYVAYFKEDFDGKEITVFTGASENLNYEDALDLYKLLKQDELFRHNHALGENFMTLLIRIDSFIYDIEASRREPWEVVHTYMQKVPEILQTFSKIEASQREALAQAELEKIERERRAAEHERRLRERKYKPQAGAKKAQEVAPEPVSQAPATFDDVAALAAHFGKPPKTRR